jgi:cytochrome oxidase Cu insertion factor (SCO1/SenC/PrrC family)
MERKRSGNPKNKKKDRTGLYVILIIIVMLIGTIAIYTSVINKNPQNGDQWGDAPDFTLTTLDGGTFTLSDNFGKVVLIDFTAENCKWCCEGDSNYGMKGQIYELLDLYEEVGSDVVFISIDPWYGYPVYETEENLRSLKERYNSNWIYAMDNSEQDVAGSYKADSGIPKIILINKDGNVYDSFPSLTAADTLLNSINEIL